MPCQCGRLKRREYEIKTTISCLLSTTRCWRAAGGFLRFGVDVQLGRLLRHQRFLSPTPRKSLRLLGVVDGTSGGAFNPGGTPGPGEFCKMTVRSWAAALRSPPSLCTPSSPSPMGPTYWARGCIEPGPPPSPSAAPLVRMAAAWRYTPDYGRWATVPSAQPGHHLQRPSPSCGCWAMRHRCGLPPAN